MSNLCPVPRLELVDRNICLEDVSCFQAELCLGISLILLSRFNLDLDCMRGIEGRVWLKFHQVFFFFYEIWTEPRNTGDFFFFKDCGFFLPFSFHTVFKLTLCFHAYCRKDLILSLLSQSFTIFWLLISVNQDGCQSSGK